MYSLNKAQIIGNLTRDPEIRTTPNGQSVANFGVATSNQWTDTNGTKQEKTEFHNIVAWAKLAEICGQYLTKGKKVYISGRLQTREWETPEGQKRQRTEIIAEDMIMLSPKGSEAPMEQKLEDSGMIAHTQDISMEQIPF
jgi:single-strand DNA-binding protein